MGQPAARLGDATAHGGVVTTGSPTVFVNGQPAAALGDLHVCPLCSPGPHVGGPVLAGAPTVFLHGKPMARVGDACACAAPAPDVIVQGSPNVFVGGAAAAAAPGAAAAAASAHGASATPGTPGTGATARPLSPWVGVGYVDKAGRPVTGWAYEAAAGGAERRGEVGTGGQVWLDALTDGGAVDVGLVGVYGCRWAKGEARVGEAVGLSARCVGVEDGAFAVFEVWRETAAAGGSLRREKVWTVLGEVAGGRITAMAPFEKASAEGEGVVTFVAEVVVEHLHRARGGPLRLVDRVEFALEASSGERLPDRPFKLISGTGEVRQGRTDAAGEAVIDNMPLGPYDVEFEDDEPAGS